MVRPDRWCFGWRPRGRRATTTARLARARRGGSIFELVVGEDGELLDPVATAAALEKREAELADRRRLRAEKLASQTEKAREMSAARRAERVAAGRENIKTFVPRYKREAGALAPI